MTHDDLLNQSVKDDNRTTFRMTTETILYEQPVNELIRACLRLESLFFQIDHAIQGTSITDTRRAVSSLLDVLYLLERPDLKTKLGKELSRFINVFNKMIDNPSVEPKKLQPILFQLESVHERLNLVYGKVAQSLRQNELLNSIRQYTLNPGGGCGFEVPAYHYWLHRPSSERIADMLQWVSQFETVREAIFLLLRLVRDCGYYQEQLANQGFFQTSLDPSAHCQLVQVLLPINTLVFPEISVGRHGIFIRFMTVEGFSKPIQSREDIPFKMTCCIL